ncbi:MAG: DUF72 domain-containing protein [Ramlibacter sp.]
MGCAGWSLPRDAQSRFAQEGSHLQRYAICLNAVEINSSFHRAHTRASYERWAEAVPRDFRFSVKLPRTVTHEGRLVATEALLDEFVGQVAGLGDRLGCLLVQLPPSLAFAREPAASFFDALGDRTGTPLALEPRHASWFTPDVDHWLAGRRIARVLADPVRHEPGRLPGGFAGRVYLRLHGSPRMYYSAYEPPVIDSLSRRIALAVREGSEVWCMFDNTAGSAAVHNALALRQALDQERRSATP